jgi:hypothetical protein
MLSFAIRLISHLFNDNEKLMDYATKIFQSYMFSLAMFMIKHLNKNSTWQKMFGISNVCIKVKENSLVTRVRLWRVFRAINHQETQPTEMNFQVFSSDWKMGTKLLIFLNTVKNLIVLCTISWFLSNSTCSHKFISNKRPENTQTKNQHTQI